MKVKELIKHLQLAYDPHEIIVYDLWTTENVDFMCTEEKVKLTRKETNQVLRNIGNVIDADYGITWDTIRCGIEDVISNREKS